MSILDVIKEASNDLRASLDRLDLPWCIFDRVEEVVDLVKILQQLDGQ